MNKSKVKKVLDEDKMMLDNFYEKLLTVLSSSDKQRLEESYNQMIEQRSILIKNTLRING